MFEPAGIAARSLTVQQWYSVQQQYRRRQNNPILCARHHDITTLYLILHIIKRGGGWHLDDQHHLSSGSNGSPHFAAAVLVVGLLRIPQEIITEASIVITFIFATGALVTPGKRALPSGRAWFLAPFMQQVLTTALALVYRTTTSSDLSAALLYCCHALVPQVWGPMDVCGCVTAVYPLSSLFHFCFVFRLSVFCLCVLVCFFFFLFPLLPCTCFFPNITAASARHTSPLSTYRLAATVLLPQYSSSSTGTASAGQHTCIPSSSRRYRLGCFLLASM